jgi:hypothetical protein
MRIKYGKAGEISVFRDNDKAILSGISPDRPIIFLGRVQYPERALPDAPDLSAGASACGS